MACHCEAGWHGDACGLRTCPKDCHRRGRCLDGRCICAARYAGAACEALASATLPVEGSDPVASGVHVAGVGHEADAAPLPGVQQLAGWNASSEVGDAW